VAVGGMEKRPAARAISRWGIPEAHAPAPANRAEKESNIAGTAGSEAPPTGASKEDSKPRAQATGWPWHEPGRVEPGDEPEKGARSEPKRPAG